MSSTTTSLIPANAARFFYFLRTYISQTGQLAGRFLAGAIISKVGDNAALQAGNPDTIFWVRVMLAVVPIVGMALVIAFVLQVPLTKKICEEIG